MMNLFPFLPFLNHIFNFWCAKGEDPAPDPEPDPDPYRPKMLDPDPY